MNPFWAANTLNYEWYISAVIFTLSTVFLLFKYSRLMNEAKNAESKDGAERMLTVHICLSLLMASLYLPMMFERLSCTYVMATMSSYFKSGIIWAPMLIYSVIFGITTAVNAKKAQKYTLVYHKLSKLCHCIFVITFALIYCLAIYISSAIFESSYGTFIRIIDIGLSWIVMTVYCSVIMLVCNIPYSIMAKYPQK